MLSLGRLQFACLWSLLVAVLVACAQLTGTAVSTSALVDLEDVPLPEAWQDSQKSSPLENLHALGATDGHYRTWVPRSETDGMPFFWVAAYRFDSERTGKRGYRRELSTLRRNYSPRQVYQSPWADDSIAFCNELSLGTCIFVARYEDILVTAAIMQGQGVTLEQAPELFALVDSHVYQVLIDGL